MISKFEWMIARRYLRPARKEGMISVIAGFSFLGITLGVAALIIVMSVMNGFRHKLMENILGFNGHIGVSHVMGHQIPDYEKGRGILEDVPGVIHAVPMIERQVMAIRKGHAQGLVVRAMTQGDLTKRLLVSENLKSGSVDDFHKGKKILIGKRFAEKMGLSVGDPLKIISPEGTSTALGVFPKTQTLRVQGIFEVGMSQFDSMVAFVPLSEAQSFFRMPQTVSAFEVFVKDPQNVRPISQAIRTHIGSDFRVLDWHQANASYATALQVERNVMFVILTLIILVASFNIISSLIMLVKDKTQDIAILRTMGAGRKTILKIFFITGHLIGLTGIMVGTALGLGFALNIETIRQWIQKLTGTNLFSPEIYFLSQLPARVNWVEVSVVIVTALLLVFFATLIPSLRAARLDPVEALRYE